MSTQTNQTNYLNPITLIGAIVGETYEQLANVGNAILEAPADFGRGFENNLFTNSPEQDKAEANTIVAEVAAQPPVPPTNEQIAEEIKRLQAMMQPAVTAEQMCTNSSQAQGSAEC